MIGRIIREIGSIRQKKKQLLIAIDGRCASGKTTLAEKLKERLSCNIIHMDDFFLRPEQRTAERYYEPGGNVDRERFAAEVLLPLKSGKAFSYRPFDCHTMKLSEPIMTEQSEITIIEGTYSCHPALWNFYDLHIFLTVSPEEQFHRLAKRSKENLHVFREKWIPLEERYFNAYKIDARCELKFKT